MPIGPRQPQDALIRSLGSFSALRLYPVYWGEFNRWRWFSCEYTLFCLLLLTQFSRYFVQCKWDYTFATTLRLPSEGGLNAISLIAWFDIIPYQVAFFQSSSTMMSAYEALPQFEASVRPIKSAITMLERRFCVTTVMFEKLNKVPSNKFWRHSVASR